MRPETLDYQQLKPLNDKLIQLISIAPDIAPSFIAKDKIAFMSSDNVIMCYQIFDNPNGEVIKNVLSNPHTKEVFNLTQASFPGSTPEIALDQIFLQNNVLIGENVFMMRIKPVTNREQYTTQHIYPNYYNTFFLEDSYNENDLDDASEMRYLQNHYKTKIEFQRELYTGYLFQARDYLGYDYQQTGVYIVNTFSYYQWRTLTLLKQQRLLIEDFSKNQLRALSYA